jgi:hypothetical protein
MKKDMKSLITILVFSMLTGCVASSKYYTTDDSSMATPFKGCHSFGSFLNLIPVDEKIRPVFLASIESRTRATFEFQFFLGPHATFVLLDKNITLILPSGEKISLPMRRAEGGVSYKTEIENGSPITAPANPSPYGWGPIILLADLNVENQLPAKLIFVTPSFKVNNLVYPSKFGFRFWIRLVRGLTS